MGGVVGKGKPLLQLQRYQQRQGPRPVGVKGGRNWVGSLPQPFTLILASAYYYGSASLLKSLLASVSKSSNSESINPSLERHPLEAEMEYSWNNLSLHVCTQPQEQQFCKRGVESEATTCIMKASKMLLPGTSRELTRTYQGGRERSE